MSFNLATILHETALATPGAPAEIVGGRAPTYRDLDEQSGRFAAGLRENGLRPGQVVALQLPNMPQFLTAYFGALKAGMVVLPLNPLLRAPEIEYHLTDSSARFLIAFDGTLGEASRACQAVGIPLYVVSSGQAPLPDGTRPVSELISDPLPAQPGGGIHPGDADHTAGLLYNPGAHRQPQGAPPSPP